MTGRGSAVARTYLSVQSNGGLSLSVKVPVSGKEALKRPNASPTGYGLGKWVSFAFAADATAPVETVKRWMLESYRAQAPKRLMKELGAQQLWVKAGGPPE